MVNFVLLHEKWHILYSAGIDVERQAQKVSNVQKISVICPGFG